MNKKALGLGLFALGLLIAIAAAVFSGGDEADPLTQAFRGRETTTLVAFIGGEKRQFVEDPKVQEILADAHGLKLDARKAGSIEMVTEPAILAQKGSLFLTRPTLIHYTAKRADLLTAAAELFAMVGRGAVRIHLNQRYALKDAAQAHRDLEARRTTGSTVLLP